MFRSIFCIVILSVSFVEFSKTTDADYKVFCFYDSRSYLRRNSGQVKLTDIEPALSQCTHLLYGYAGLSLVDYRLISLNKRLDTDKIFDYYNEAIKMKTKYPNLKILLSMGGGADHDDPKKYLKMLESVEARTNFIDSALALLKEYGFDGINLGWQFPPNKGKKPHNSMSALWHKLKKTVTGEHVVDSKHEEHKEQFAKLVRSMKLKFSEDGLMITASVLPNVKSSLFFDFTKLSNQLDYIILHAFDFYTPSRNEKEADYAHPLKHVNGRYSDININEVVTEWISNSFPPKKIILGIPTFGRAWKIKSKSDSMGKPPISVDGPAHRGPMTNVRGLRSYYEICSSIIVDRPTQSRYLNSFHDRELKCGPYAYKYPNEEDDYGEWISYEDVDDVAYKMTYIKEKSLGGVAIVDLSLDDFNGVCSEGKFPLLKAAASNLNN